MMMSKRNHNFNESASSIVDLMGNSHSKNIIIGKNEKLRYRETLQKQIKLKKQLEYLAETRLTGGELAAF